MRLFLFSSVISFATCSLPAVKHEAPEINHVKMNSKFKINLPENHKTGYLWQLTKDFDNRLIEDLGPVWHGNEKGIDFNLKTNAIGQTTLNFVLRKHTDTSGVKSFIINIVEN